MATRNFAVIAGCASLVPWLAGCGTQVPGLHEFYDSQDANTMIESIVEDVQCEVTDGVQSLILDDTAAAHEAQAIGAPNTRPSVEWLKDWAAQVTLTLTIDEKSSFNPGLAITPPLASVVTSFPNKITTTTPQTFSFGLGGSISADATRKETLSWLINFQDMTTTVALAKAEAERQAHGTPQPCGKYYGPLIESDLKLKEWLYSAVLAAFVRGGAVADFSGELAAGAKASKKDAIAHEITFVILYGGNVTPSWKLLRVSINQGSLPFLGAQRTRTQDLLVSMGPYDAKAGTLSPAAQNTTLASQIGQAVANAIRNTQ